MPRSRGPTPHRSVRRIGSLRFVTVLGKKSFIRTTRRAKTYSTRISDKEFRNEVDRRDITYPTPTALHVGRKKKGKDSHEAIGFVSKKYDKEKYAFMRKHQLMHSLQHVLHDRAGLGFRSFGTLARFEEACFFPIFENARKSPVISKEINEWKAKHLNDPTYEKTIHATIDRRYIDVLGVSAGFRFFLQVNFPTKRPLIDAIMGIFSNPSMRPVLSRLNRSNEKTIDSKQVRDDLHVLVGYFKQKAEKE